MVGKFKQWPINFPTIFRSCKYSLASSEWGHTSRHAVRNRWDSVKADRGSACHMWLTDTMIRRIVYDHIGSTLSSEYDTKNLHFVITKSDQRIYRNTWEYKPKKFLYLSQFRPAIYRNANDWIIYYSRIMYFVLGIYDYIKQ